MNIEADCKCRPSNKQCPSSVWKKIQAGGNGWLSSHRHYYLLGEIFDVLIVANRWGHSHNRKMQKQEENVSICLYYWDFSLIPICESLCHYHLSFYFGFNQILTSMTELISSARRLASSSMSLPSFKVFSVCRFPLSIASFFSCRTAWSYHQNAFR